VLVFAGFSRNDKSALLLAESTTINAGSDVDDFVDQAWIVPDMNQRYGQHVWTSMQDGARVQTASSTMACLEMTATVIEDWPACSPDLNPIEN
jgi:hypothetical protein